MRIIKNSYMVYKMIAEGSPVVHKLNLVSQLRGTIYTRGYSDNYSGLIKYTTHCPKYLSNCMKYIFCRNYKNVDVKFSAHGVFLE